MTLYLCLGSNLGDRRRHLRLGTAAVRAALAPAAVRAARVTSSAPWGYLSPNAYLNQCLRADLGRSADPLWLLRRMQGVERRFNRHPHRLPDGSYADRELDVDIVCIEGVRRRSPRLALPHPRAAARPFVAIPVRALRRENVTKTPARPASR